MGNEEEAVHALSEEVWKERPVGEAKCALKLTHTVIVPEEKPFYRFLYRGQHLSFDFRKSPNRK